MFETINDLKKKLDQQGIKRTLRSDQPQKCNLLC